MPDLPIPPEYSTNSFRDASIASWQIDMTADVADNLSYHIELSTRPEEKYIGDIAIWDKSEAALAAACKAAGKDYKINLSTA